MGCFNPRARVGRDALYGHGIAAMRTFQSTRPRGARLQQAEDLRRVPHVSIHAPAWGATVFDLYSRMLRDSFNPRARVGRDRVYWFWLRLPERFNPRARVGRDVGSLKI